MYRKILTVIFGLMIYGLSYGGVTMCKHNRTFILVLSKSTNGTSAQHNATDKTWSVTFDYTTMSGIAACNDISGTVNTANTGLVTSTADVGSHCWCYMEKPATSYWTYLKSYGNATTCASDCASDCADAIKTSTPFRTGVFESIW